MSTFKEVVDDVMEDDNIRHKAMTDNKKEPEEETPGKDDAAESVPEEETPGKDDAAESVPEEESPGNDDAAESVPEEESPGKDDDRKPVSDTLVEQWASNMKTCKELLDKVASDPVANRFRTKSHLEWWKVDYINRLHTICAVASHMFNRQICIEPAVVEMAVNNGIPALMTFYEYHVEATTVGCANPDSYNAFASQVSLFRDICISCTRSA